MHRHNSFNNNVSRSPSLTQRKLGAEFRPSSPLVGGSPVSTTETHQTVITKNSWLDAARESTNKFKLNGSPLPLVWILVEDNVIPPNAVPFGEDKNGSQLYIARALLEGGLYLGRVGTHLQHALISYGGREHHIQKYEVLVCASQVRWGLASYDSAGSLSQGTVVLAQQNQQLQSQRGSTAWSTQAGGFSQHGGSPGGFVAPSGSPAGYAAPSGSPAGYAAPFGSPAGYAAPSGSPGGYAAPSGSPGGYAALSGSPASYAPPSGSPAGYAAHTGYSNVREVSSVRETRSAYSSRENSSLVIETTLRVDDIPRFIPNLEDLKLRKLADYKTVVLIDDSISMAEEQSWTLVRGALAGIADLANQYGSQGIDLHFLHQEHYHQNIKTSHEVQQIFDQMAPNGPETPTAAKLEELINTYLPLVERKFPRHNPIDIIVITDGVATDQQALPEVIVSAAQRLERSQVPEGMFGIQFVQIGTDAEAALALRALDDHLEQQYKVRDIVDTTPYDPQQGAFNTDYMLKILLGGVNKVLDNGGPVPSELLSIPVPYGPR
ncbi:hypothetical protein C8R48DRAFT_777014 [Suillus tomentosus]|nr:hypothetical protein C8R48DRAFT_777014 [Suillus tomentosus]